MTENIGIVKNPLTIIAIFAGLAEVGGTVALPFMDKEVQQVYVWFLFIFPILLVVLFFFVLFFRHHVFYAPSDYQNEDYFAKFVKPVTLEERVENVKEKISESEVSSSDVAAAETVEHDTTSFSVRRTEDGRFGSISLQRYLIVEEMVLGLLENEFGGVFGRGMGIEIGGKRFFFDGVKKHKNKIIGVEVKYYRDIQFAANAIKDQIGRLKKSLDVASNDFLDNAKIIFVIVSDSAEGVLDSIRSKLNSMVQGYEGCIDIRMYNYDKLESLVKKH